MNRAIYSRKKRPHSHHHPYFEEAVLKSQQVLRQFVHTLPVAICVIDRREHTYLDVNESFAEMAGLNRADILNMQTSDICAGLGEANLANVLDRLAEGQPVEQLELDFASGAKLIRGLVHAEWIEYGERDCVLITFVQTSKPESRQRPTRQESRLAVAGDIGRSLAETVDPDEMYRRLTHSIFQMLPDVQAVIVSLFDPSSQRLCVAHASTGAQTIDPAQFSDQPIAPPGQDFLSDAVRVRRTLIANELQNSSQAPSFHLSAPHFSFPIKSAIFAPMVAKGEVIGAIQAQSGKPARFQPADAALLTLIGNTAAIAIQNIRLSQNLEQTSHDLAETYEATIDGWTRALLLRDSITEGHTHRVIGLTVELGKKLGLESTDLVRVKRGAQLHDIGKIGIEDKILRKDGPLDDAEWREMRKHPLYAYELLRPIPRFSEILDIPYCHHEKWDGSGYPRRLQGQEIPLTARIFSIVDVFDALSSHRPYRQAWPQSQVLDYIQSQDEKHFEPVITSAFLELVRGKNRNPRPPGVMIRGSTTTFFLS